MKVLFIGGTGTISTACTALTAERGIELFLLNRGQRQVDPPVSGVVSECIELEEEGFLFFDKAGDLEKVDGRGVGFPGCEFDMEKGGNK